jgi:hypothetical protein
MANTIIPAVGTRGRFILAPPFEAAMTPNTIYHLAATREYEDIEALGQNIFELFYKPFNLLESDLQADRSAGAVLVTLMTANSRPLYVPSTYVTFPDLNFKPYNQFVACLSFGPLPNSTIFDSVIQALKNTTSDFLGVEPEINIAFMPLTDLITPAEHDTLEAVRQAAIADRTTDYARLAEANAKIALLSQRNAILEKIIIDNGLLP